MVNNEARLNSTFSALSDPTRRRILQILSQGEQRVTELAEPFAMSLPAVSKHLRVLEDAGLLLRTREGRVHRMRADPEGLRGAREWIEQYVRYWEDQFEALDRFLQETRPPDQPEEDAG